MSGSFSFKSAAFGPVPDHLHGKWSYHCSDRETSPDLQCILSKVLSSCTLILISGSGGEVDSSHHLLDLFFILQYVGSHGTNLVLLVLDQLLQLS